VATSRKVNDSNVIRRVLTTPATWAVVGLSTDTSRTAYGVARWMKDRLGHRIVPVHPRAVEVWGEPGYRRLADIPDGATIDVVDCFVSSANVGRVVDQAIEQRDRLGIGTVWLQLGVIDHAAAQRALDAGLEVVMDTCPKMEFPHL
jgi:predicted CoA-binding protein